MTFNINGILILVEEEVLAEPEYEIPDVVHNLLLQHSFVYIFDIAGVQFLRIDEVQKVFILECTKGATRALGIGNCSEEVVRKRTTMMVIIFFDRLNDSLFAEMRHCRQTDVEQTFFAVFSPLNDSDMLRERNRQELT